MRTRNRILSPTSKQIQKTHIVRQVALPRVSILMGQMLVMTRVVAQISMTIAKGKIGMSWRRGQPSVGFRLYLEFPYVD